eukprot:45193-Hanusia_phi.AAC.3
MRDTRTRILHPNTRKSWQATVRLTYSSLTGGRVSVAKSSCFKEYLEDQRVTAAKDGHRKSEQHRSTHRFLEGEASGFIGGNSTGSRSNAASSCCKFIQRDGPSDVRANRRSLCEGHSGKPRS